MSICSFQFLSETTRSVKLEFCIGFVMIGVTSLWDFEKNLVARRASNSEKFTRPQCNLYVAVGRAITKIYSPKRKLVRLRRVGEWNLKGCIYIYWGIWSSGESDQVLVLYVWTYLGFSWALCLVICFIKLQVSQICVGTQEYSNEIWRVKWNLYE